MPHSISHNTSDHWASVSNPSKTQPLRLTKRRPKSPTLPQDSASSSLSLINAYNDGVSNSAASPTQPPPQNPSLVPLFDSNDPAFSSDPSHHPDHDSSSPSSGIRKDEMSKSTPLSQSTSLNTEDEPPPSYADSVPASNQEGSLGRPQQQNASTSSLGSSYSNEEVQESSHIRERAQTSDSPISTPVSSFPNLPQPRQSEQDDVAEQEELLAYLSDDRNVLESASRRNVPMSLRPHQGLPVAAQTPVDIPGRSHQGPNTTGILRSATLPSSTTRTMSEPVERSGTERPHFPRRGNTTAEASIPRRAPAELDRIDELDESTPSGLPLHHRGPYEMRGKVNTPPPRVAPLDRQHQPPPKQHVLVATTPLNAPPQPVPFRLNLKPGEFLTRVPPSRSQTTPPERIPPVATGPYLSSAAEQPVYEQRGPPLQQNRAIPRNGYREDVRNGDEWSPEQLYDDYSQFPSSVQPRDVQRLPYQTDGHDNSASSSENASRSDLRTGMVSSVHTRVQQERAPIQKHVSFHQPPQQNSPLSRSVSQPVYPSSASTCSTSSSGMSRVPPLPADRHRPKRIVMPAPLLQQNQNQNTNYTPPSELMRRAGQSSVPIQPSPPSQPVAAVIPIHDPKKGNFLKKRVSMGPSHKHHHHLAPERMSSTKGFFGLGLGFGKSLTPEPESNLPKASRKLSKRGKL